MQNKKIDFLIIILIIFIIGLLFYPVFLGKIIHSDDIKELYFNFKILIKDNILYNNYIYSGTPYITNPQSSFFYPDKFFLYIFTPERMLSISIILHLMLGSVFFYLYLKKFKINYFFCFIGALIWGLSGFNLQLINEGHYIIIIGLNYLPAILWSLENIKKNNIYLIIISLFLTLQFYAGYPWITYISFNILFLYLFFVLKFDKKLKKDILAKTAYMLIIALLFFILIAPLLLLNINFALNSVRASGIDYTTAAKYSLSYDQLILFFIPKFFGATLNNNYQGFNFEDTSLYFSVFAGIVFLLFIFCVPKKRKEKFFLFLFFLGIFLALGKNFFIYKLFYKYMPFFKIFRGPVRYAILLSIAMPYIIAKTLQYFYTVTFISHRKTFIFFILIFTFCISILLLLKIYPSASHEFITQNIKEINSIVNPDNKPSVDFFIDKINANFSNMVKQYFIFCLFSIISFSLILRLFFSYRTILYIVIFVIFDLFIYSRGYMNFVNKQSFYKIPQEIQEIKKIENKNKNFRVWFTDYSSVSNFIYFDLETIEGYDPAILNDYLNFFPDIDKNNIVHTGRIKLKKIDRKILDLMAVKYIITDKNLSEIIKGQSSNIILIKDFGKNKIYLNKNAFKIGYINSVFDYMKNFYKKDFKNKTYFYPGVKEKIVDASSIGYNNWHYLKNIADEKIIEYKINNYAYFNLQYNYFPGFKAYIDNKRINIYKANNSFIAIPLEEGNHILRIVFGPDEIYIGLKIFLSGVIFLIFIIIYLIGKEFYFIHYEEIKNI